MKSGLLEGNFHLGGLVSDPEFTGNFVANDFLIAIPNYIPVDLLGKRVEITAENNSFNINDALFIHGKSQVGLDLQVLFDRWSFEELFIHVKTLNETLVPVDCNVPFIKLTANATCDLEMFLTSSDFELNGNINAQDTIVYLALGGNESEEATGDDNGFRMDLTINIEHNTPKQIPVRLAKSKTILSKSRKSNYSWIGCC